MDKKLEYNEKKLDGSVKRLLNETVETMDNLGKKTV